MPAECVLSIAVRVPSQSDRRVQPVPIRTPECHVTLSARPGFISISLWYPTEVLLCIDFNPPPLSLVTNLTISGI